MEMLLYLIGNWCCIIAAAILLKAHHLKKTAPIDRESEPAPKPIISKDMQVMLFIGSLLRVYWSVSPPSVWSDEVMVVQWISIADVFCSPMVWAAVLYTIGMQQNVKFETPIWGSWPVLTLAAGLLGMCGAPFLPPLENDNSFPFADTFVVFNMVLDGFAMVPQMALLAYSKEKTSSEGSHFVGLLCLGRMFRMVFWAILLVSQYTRGVSHGHYIWTFIVPDIVHSAIMGDFLYVWMQRVKRDQIDPYMSGLAVNV